MISLYFSPTEEVRISTVARQIGLAPADYIKKLVAEHLPTVPTESTPAIDSENAAAIVLLQSWMKEEATDDPEEILQAEEDLNELLQNLNKNRIESGERPLFP